MRSCEVCGTSLEGRQRNAATCSQSCRNKRAHAARMREKAKGGRISRAHYYNVKGRADRKGIPFAISLDEIEVPDRCPITLERLVTTGPHAGNRKPSVDRIDPTKGYVPGNVAVISCGANRAKSNLSIAAVRRLLAYMEATLG